MPQLLMGHKTKVIGYSCCCAIAKLTHIWNKSEGSKFLCEGGNEVNLEKCYAHSLWQESGGNLLIDTVTQNYIA